MNLNIAIQIALGSFAIHEGDEQTRKKYLKEEYSNHTNLYYLISINENQLRAKLQEEEDKLQSQRRIDEDFRRDELRIQLLNAEAKLEGKRQRLQSVEISNKSSSEVKEAKRIRDSAGSASSDGSNSTQNLFIYIDHFLIENSSTIIHVGMRPLEHKIVTLAGNFFQSIPEISNDQLGKLCNLTSSDVKDEWNQYNLPTGRDQNEKSLQDYLTDNCECFSAIDTHDPPEKAVEFMSPRDFNDTTVFSRTARAHLTSQMRRQVFEVKRNHCESELIQQIMERVVVSMDMCHLLKNSIAFGATPGVAFVCIGTREIPSDRNSLNTKNIHIYRVPRDKVCEMWMLASNNIHGPESYLTDDGPFVLHGLRALGIDPWLCRIHLSWWSQNRVYEITLPQIFDFPISFQKSENEDASATKCFGVNSKNSTFALKVIHNTLNFDRELEALDAVAPSFFIGGYRFANRVETLKKIMPSPSASFSLDPNGWWGKTTSENNCPSEGGVLVMEIGEQLQREKLTAKESQQVFSNCLNSLSALHEKGYSHTDVRLANIVKFGGTYQVIDFGEVVKHTDNMSVPWVGFSKSRKELVVYETEKNWTIRHDIEMLGNALFYNLMRNEEA